MKKIIPALALLLISAVVMSTASFAWFSMNTTVKATGMQVTATTASSLVISNSSTGTFDQTANGNYSSNTLTPSSTSNLTDFWYVSGGTIAGYDNAAATANTEFTKAAASNNGPYYLMNSYFFKVQGSSTTDKFAKLYVSEISVKDNGSAPDSAISNALRVGLKCGNKVYIYAPNSSSTTTYAAISSTSTGTITYGDGTACTANVTMAALGNTSNLLDSGVEITTTGTVEVQVYIWYEGQDASCTSANSVNTETLDVEISFAAEKNA